MWYVKGQKKLGCAENRRWRLGGQSEQNIVKCFWPSGKMHFAIRRGLIKWAFRASDHQREPQH